MKTRNRKRSAMLTFSMVLIGLSLACVAWVKKEQRQYALNRQLIEALVKSDTKQAIALVEQGADPNTPVEITPAPSLTKRIQEWIHHGSPPIYSSPTAFVIVCGGSWYVGSRHGKHRYRRLPDSQLNDPQLTQVAQTMLAHGANVNARDDDSWTALMSALCWCPSNRMTLLLEHGANIDLQDGMGNTALHRMVSYNDVETVKLLLKYHANVNIKNRDGETPLHLARPVGIAQLAQAVDSPSTQHYSPQTEIIRLLKQAGAKE